MKSVELLILFLLAKVSICDDSPTTTQQGQQWSCGRIKLIKIRRGWWPFRKWEYKLQFFESTFNNDTILREYMADKIECNSCRLSPYDEESCRSKSCNLPQFDCIWRNHGCTNLSSLTTMSTSKAVYPNTTMAFELSKTAGHNKIPVTVMILGTITSLLCLLLVLLIAGWMWTCWITKKRAAKSSQMINGTGLNQQSNGHSTTVYENTSLNEDVTETKFKSLATYSLLSPDNEIKTATGRGRVANGGDRYCTLDRSSGKAKIKTDRREQVDGYSRLFSN